ncbi:MAG: 50S ribosomal protein L10 [Firmicutes bacterium]|nr:50S ribosomal protein L10 [Bacillota bacterium]
MSEKIIAKKADEVASVKSKIASAKSIIILDYRGVSVFEDTQMRVALRKENIEYKVIKNNIMLRALKQAGYKDFDGVLQGPTAVAFGYDDAVMPAKILAESIKKYNKMKIKGGIAEGKVLSAEEAIALSKMPAKPTLVAQLLGLLTSPMRGLAVAVSEIAKKKV